MYRFAAMYLLSSMCIPIGFGIVFGVGQLGRLKVDAVPSGCRGMRFQASIPLDPVGGAPGFPRFRRFQYTQLGTPASTH